MSRPRKSFTDRPCLICFFMEWLEGCETWSPRPPYPVPPVPLQYVVSIATAPTQEALENQWQGKWFPGSDKEIKKKTKKRLAQSLKEPEGSLPGCRVTCQPFTHFQTSLNKWTLCLVQSSTICWQPGNSLTADSNWKKRNVLVFLKKSRLWTSSSVHMIFDRWMSITATCRSVDKLMCSAGNGWVIFLLVCRFSDYSWAGGFGQHHVSLSVSLLLCISPTNFSSRWKTGTTALKPSATALHRHAQQCNFILLLSELQN